MIKKILFICISLCFVFSFSQKLKPVAQKNSEYHARKIDFEKYDLFEMNPTSSKLAEYKRSATDITIMNINAAQLKKNVIGKPEFIEVSFPFEGDKTITMELYKNQILTNDFKIKTNKGEAVNYTPGVYYQGIIKGDNTSILAFSFFDNDVLGVVSASESGNVMVGKAKNSEDFVSYSDSKLTGANPFKCGSNELKENKYKSTPSNSNTSKKTLTENCVRVYYEICYTPYNFSINRPIFNGDLGHLVNIPTAPSISFLNSLYGSNRYAYSGVSQTYNNVPVYSWTIQAMTHVMGSPHLTHMLVLGMEIIQRLTDMWPTSWV